MKSIRGMMKQFNNILTALLYITCILVCCLSYVDLCHRKYIGQAAVLYLSVLLSPPASAGYSRL